MRQLRWRRAAAMLATSATRLDVRAGDLCRCVSIPRHPPRCRVNQANRSQALRARRLLLVEVRLRFSNVYSRPIRVRRASQVPQGRVPLGVHTARPVSRSCTAVSSTDRAESPGLRGVSSSPVHRAYVSACEGPRHRGIV